MDANLEIAQMRQDVVESINKHHMPVAVTVLLLQNLLVEAQEQYNKALEAALNDTRKKEDGNKAAVM